MDKRVFLKYANALQFKKIIEAVNVVNNEVTVRADQDGFHITIMDPCHFGMVVLDFFKTACDEFSLSEPFTFTLNIPELLKAPLKNVKKEDWISLDVSGKEIIKANNGVDQVYADWNALVTLAHRFKRETEISLLEPKDEECPKPKISFTVRTKIVLDDLADIIKDAALYDQYLRIEASPDKLEFSNSGDLGKFRVPIEKYSESLLSLEVNEESKAVYSLNYLADFFRVLKPLQDLVTLEFSQDMPIKISVDLNYINLCYYLAPYKEDSYESNKTEEPKEEPKEEIEETETVDYTVAAKEAEELINPEGRTETEEPKSINHIYVVFLEDFPSLVGFDLKTYGPYTKGQIDEIPEGNTKILIEEGKAITLQTYRDARKKLLSIRPGYRGDFNLEVLKPYIPLE